MSTPPVNEQTVVTQETTTQIARLLHHAAMCATTEPASEADSMLALGLLIIAQRAATLVPPFDLYRPELDETDPVALLRTAEALSREVSPLAGGPGFHEVVVGVLELLEQAQA